MAQRLFFYTTGELVKKDLASFDWTSGLDVSQIQKNIAAFHEAIKKDGKKPLEISTKGTVPLGVKLSAFNLKLDGFALECLYQASKVYENGGPYTDLLLVSSRDAKRDERLRTSGPLVGFRFEGQAFPLQPQTAFYDYVYICALLENEDLANIVLGYDAFTDVEFGTARSLNCQAQAAALFVSLHRLGLTDRLHSFEEFLDVLQLKRSDDPAGAPQHSAEQQHTYPEMPLQPGSCILHKLWGKGRVTAVSSTVAEIDFPSVGKKKLGLQWIRQNCSPGD